MFREMRRFKQLLSRQECLEILKKEPRGVLAVSGDDGYPYAFPMNFYYDEVSGKIYFHAAKTGHKMDAIQRNDKVSFCVHDAGYRKPGEWALNIKSVIVFGRIRVMEDRETVIEKVRQFALKYYPTPESVEDEIRKDGHAVQCLELTIEHMTGKLVHES